MSFYLNSIDVSRQIAKTGIRGRGKVKQVFKYPQLAHVWAQQEQEHGRSPKGQMYFHGETIFSYGEHFPIARFTEATLDGQRVVLFNSEKYGPTTSTHKDCVAGALRGLPVKVFHVPNVTYRFSSESLHNQNVTHLIERFAKSAASLARAHVRDWRMDRHPETYADLLPKEIEAARLESVQGLAADVIDYCRAFNLELPELDIEAKKDKIRAAFTRYYSEKQIAKRAAKDAEKVSRHWKTAAHIAAFFEGVTDRKPNLHFMSFSAKDAVAKHFNCTSWALEDRLDQIARRNYEAKRRHSSKGVTAAQWKEGKGSVIDDNGFNIPTFVRRVGDTLETSRGAECPFSHAVVAFLKAQQCRATGTTWQRNGQQIRVGHFNVDSIDAEGNMRAGCHLIMWPEMLRLAIREIPQMVKPSFGLPVVL